MTKVKKLKSNNEGRDGKNDEKLVMELVALLGVGAAVLSNQEWRGYNLCYRKR